MLPGNAGRPCRGAGSQLGCLEADETFTDFRVRRIVPALCRPLRSVILSAKATGVAFTDFRVPRILSVLGRITGSVSDPPLLPSLLLYLHLLSFRFYTRIQRAGNSVTSRRPMGRHDVLRTRAPTAPMSILLHASCTMVVGRCVRLGFSVCAAPVRGTLNTYLFSKSFPPTIVA